MIVAGRVAPVLQPDAFVRVPAATIVVGDVYGDGFVQERPAHEVSIAPFYIGRHCVTVGDYFSFMIGSGDMFQESWCDYVNPCFVLRTRQGYVMQPGCETFPMCQVNVRGAMAYCNALSSLAGLAPVYDLATLEGDLGKSGFRLPTEAEWEYACGGPSRLKYGSSQDYDAKLFNHKDYSGDQMHRRAAAQGLGGFCIYPGPLPVGSLPPNEFGLHEMLGNVNEWCNDRYVPYSARAAGTSAEGRSGAFRVVRGGSFNDPAKKIRTSYRYAVNQNTKCMVHGFRLARNAG
jgi:sulfatase modifying factor 1